MTNSAKKKKQRKADFQKVKLKLGRKLPKGNVVNTTFKAKKIVIRDQLKQKTDSPGKADKNIKVGRNSLKVG